MESAARYQALFESSPDAIFVLEAAGPEAGRILSANPAAAVMHGYSLDELLRLRIQDLDTPERQGQTPGRLAELQAGRTLVFEGEHRRKDGSVFPVEVTASLLRLDGQTRILAIDRDVTERKRSRQALIDREERLRAIINVEPECVKLLDPDGRLREMNPAGLAITEADSLDQVRGRPVVDLVRPEWRAAFLEFHRRVMAGNTATLEFEFTGLKGNRRWMESHGAPLRDEAGRVTAHVSVSRDITARRQAEQESREARSALERANATLAETNRQLHESIERANRMARAAEAASRAKSEFLATMSHEIRTPMNGVLGFINLLAESPLTPDQREQVEIIRSSSQTLLALINDILDLSKIEAGGMELDPAPCNLRTLLTQTIALLSPRAAAKGLRLETALAPGVPEIVITDATRLRQVLLNLVGNGIKFSDQGRVHVTVHGGDDPVDASDGGLRLHFRVQDSGIGIPPAQFDRLFKAFSQVDTSTTRRFGGTGLGLVISKRLCTLMGGDIQVESTPGVGSTFHFDILTQLPAPPGAPGIPRPEIPTPAENRPAPQPAPEGPMAVRQPAPAPPLASAIHSAARQAPPRAGLKILLVEDNRINQALGLALLRKAGCTTVLAKDGNQALAQLQAEQFDLVIMDVCMPEMDGYETTRRIRAGACGPERQGVTIVAMTANAMEEDRARCLAAGMDDYLSKPIHSPDLFALLERVARQQAEAADRRQAP